MSSEEEWIQTLERYVEMHVNGGKKRTDVITELREELMCKSKKCTRLLDDIQMRIKILDDMSKQQEYKAMTKHEVLKLHGLLYQVKTNLEKTGLSFNLDKYNEFQVFPWSLTIGSKEHVQAIKLLSEEMAGQVRMELVKIDISQAWGNSVREGRKKTKGAWSDAENDRFDVLYPTSSRSYLLTAFRPRTWLALQSHAEKRHIHRTREAVGREIQIGRENARKEK